MAIDGDTLQILPADEGCRVRLWGVNTAEVHQPGGQEATDALRAALTGETVDCSESRRASYGRTVAVCNLPDGRDVAELLVRSGHAADWPEYSGGHYAPAEAEARRHGRGMWGD